MDDLAQAVDINPSDSAAFAMRAGILRSIGPLRLDEALADYDAAIALAPKATKGKPGWKAVKNNYYNRGNVLMRLDKFEEAVASFDQAIAFDPKFSQAIANRGISQKNIGRTNEAEASFQAAKTINPEHVQMETTEMSGDDLSTSKFAGRIKTTTSQRARQTGT